MVQVLLKMGYEKKYVSRAMRVRKKSKFGTNWNVSLMVELIKKLKEKDKRKNTDIFHPHFTTMDEPLKLRIGDTVDYRYENGLFMLSTIIENNVNYNNQIIKLHPFGRPMTNTKYDRYCNILDEYTKLAPAKSISCRKNPV